MKFLPIQKLKPIDLRYTSSKNQIDLKVVTAKNAKNMERISGENRGVKRGVENMGQAEKRSKIFMYPEVFRNWEN